jgi:zona occludens toxin
MAERIIPALSKGREVVAYVEGIDHARIAELVGITEERCREMLFTLTREQMQKDWLSHCRDNALHVFDEAQNFWGNRSKLTDAQTQLVTEHRHRGMDIVLMGQDLRDVNATWRRRVELKLSFLKLNGIKLPKLLQVLTFHKFGTENGYSVTTYRHLGGDNFQRLGLSVRNYDPKFFGTYKSHVTDDTNTEVYTDKRAQVWNHPMLKYGMPAMAIAAGLGLWKSWAYFHPAPTAAAPTSQKAASSTAAQPFVATQRPTAPVAASAPVDDSRSPIEKRMADLQSKGRIRLAGLISSKTHTSGIIEWVQGGSTVIERLSLDALRALGVAVIVTEDSVVTLAVGDFKDIATTWPLEDIARVSEARQAAIRGPAPIYGATEPPTFRGSSSREAPDYPGNLTHIQSPR